MKNSNLNIRPTICICVAVKNGAKTIEETIKSLLIQDYPNFEILICDNNSEDNTKSIVLDLVSNTSIKLTYLTNLNAGSAESNWNYLLNNLPDDIDYFALYHSDDLYNYDIISKQYKVLCESGVGAVFTQSKLIDEKSRDVTQKYNHYDKFPFEIRNEEIFDYDTLLNYTFKYHNIIRTPSFFFHRKILDENNVLFDEKFKTSADLDFWLRIAKRHKIAIINEPLLFYRISKNQGSYTLLHNRIQLGDYFKVMDSHINNSIKRKTSECWYNAHKNLELIFCSINLIKINRKDEAVSFLNKAISWRYLSKILKIRNGFKVYMFGVVLRISTYFGIEKLLIRLIKY